MSHWKAIICDSCNETRLIEPKGEITKFRKHLYLKGWISDLTNDYCSIKCQNQKSK